MSAITIDNDLVHYEVLGRGRPVVFLHGWLGSWRYWVPTMQQLSMKYRTYAIDMWGFGDSSKDQTRYGLQSQVYLLFSFFERLGIPKAAIIGHSLGAAVGLNFARQYPDRVYRMMLISAPLFDLGGITEDVPLAAAPTTPALPPSHAVETVSRNPFRSKGESPEELIARLKAKTANPSGEAAAGTASTTGTAPVAPRPATPSMPVNIAKVTAPVAPPAPSSTAIISKPSDASNPLPALLGGVKPGALLLKHIDRDVPDLEVLKAEVEKTDERALAQSAESFNNVNLALELKRVVAPTLLLHGESDSFITPPTEALMTKIGSSKQPGQFLQMVEPGVRHFPMMEITAKFNRLLTDFLETPDLANVQLKEQWKRTLR
jgi:pimeloyl-ACP methyl ester carboxylesterase